MVDYLNKIEEPAQASMEVMGTRSRANPETTT
jgi:hypothetical protein